MGDTIKFWLWVMFWFSGFECDGLLICLKCCFVFVVLFCVV